MGHLSGQLSFAIFHCQIQGGTVLTESPGESDEVKAFESIIFDLADGGFVLSKPLSPAAAQYVPLESEVNFEIIQLWNGLSLPRLRRQPRI